jgi:hypothetical protein
LSSRKYTRGQPPTATGRLYLTTMVRLKLMPYVPDGTFDSTWANAVVAVWRCGR